MRVMDTNTFYYTLSTIPQVLAATTAVLAAFMHYRLRRITDFLVGEGQVAYDRLGTKGYELSDQNSNRLRDGISRRNIAEIKEPLKLMRDKEKEHFTLKQRPKGLQFNFDKKFCKTENYKLNLELFTKIVIIISVFTILFSLICLSKTDYIFENALNCYIINYNIYLFVISLVGSLVLVLVSFRKTIYENLNKRDKLIEKNKNSKC